MSDDREFSCLIGAHLTDHARLSQFTFREKAEGLQLNVTIMLKEQVFVGRDVMPRRPQRLAVYPKE
ncbi:MAG: hypothetical protein Q7T19_04920 [Caulobacter sp.]|nr:hypothetical protein [Caulobacter sp.]